MRWRGGCVDGIMCCRVLQCVAVAALLLLLQMQTNAGIRLARRNFLRSRFSEVFLALSLHAFVYGTFQNQCARNLNLI